MSSPVCGITARHIRDSLSWMSQQLETIFGELGLSQYLNAFLDQGFDSWETILDITESDLDALGVKLGHRRKLQRRIANSRGVAPGVSLAPVSQSNAEDARLPDAPPAEALRPDTRETTTVVITKRKYRRHPKPDPNAPERPPSAYVLFSNKKREELKGHSLTFTEIAKLVGVKWQSLTQAEKEVYESQAQVLKDKYHIELAEYKKTEKYREYQTYLKEFKAKHSAPSQDKDGSKRIKLEAGAPRRNSASRRGSRSVSRSTTSRRGSRSASRSLDRQESQQPRSMTRLDSAMGPCLSPSPSPTSPQELIRSPTMNTADRHSAERSPTFSTSTGDLPPIPTRRSSQWMEDQRSEHPGIQRYLPSLYDVVERQRCHPQELNGFGFPREHPSPGPLPGLVGGDNRPLMLRKEDSSAGSASSGSSYGYPRTPGDGLPIHALLSQQQSYFPSMPAEHKYEALSPISTNGYPNGNVMPHSPAMNPPNHQRYGAAPSDSNPPHASKEDANLNGINNLLKASEIVNRRPQQ